MMTMMSSLLLWWVTLGSFVPQNEIMNTGTVETINSPLYEWVASRYDYDLNVNWQIKPWSKNHDTCALRVYERYQTYKVCTEEKCITCYHNDFGPKREDRVIDLSSHAFKQLAPLKQWLVHVKVYLVDEPWK